MASRNEERQLGVFWATISVVAILLPVVTFLALRDLYFLKLVFGILVNFWWIILPFPAWFIFKGVWGEYTDMKFAVAQKYVLLEVIVPSDIERSPKVMEQVFYGCHQSSRINKFEEHCGWRPMQVKFTFEIVSTEGKVRFLLHCTEADRNTLESHIYSFYPTAEIFEVEDYTKEVPLVLPNRDWDVWGSTFALVNEDALPIRTYSYFKEDVTGKMIDPLASLLEVMGSIGKGQHLWYQIIFTALEAHDWKPDAEAYIAKLTKRAKVKKSGWFSNLMGELGVLPSNLFKGYFSQELEGVSSEGSSDKFNINELTPGEQEQLQAISDNVSRMAFATSIRLVYLGKRDVFSKSVGVGGPMGALKLFADVNLNGLKPDNKTKTYADYYFTQARNAYRQRKIVHNYRNRSFSGASFVFHTDELATVFHFPDMSVKVANVSRIEAQKSDAPTNLPVEDGVVFESSR
ncbi:MAG TPA: hypothetical protein GX706_00145 [Candidatus Moranbacteria bacterium]|nr:hypothetical protein [Candidatus Moranbacteria bacterium]